MEFETKVLNPPSQRSMRVTIPLVVKEILELKTGDSLIWTVSKTGKISIKKKQETEK